MKQNLAILAASVASGLIGGATVTAVNFVELQPSSPGTTQTGNLNIDGTGRFGRVGVGVAPGVAQIQAQSTGTVQAIRGQSASAAAVFGAATATSGIAPGGYFTNRSNGSAAVIGDALSLSGNTVGGLFYNRSIAGIGVSGRQLNLGGTGAAVQGTAASSAATGVKAVNTGNNSNVFVAGPARGVYVDGGTYTQNYGNGALAAVPIAYGFVNTNGTRGSGTPNWTSTYNAGLARYEITITGEAVLFTEYSTVVTRTASPGFARTGSSTGALLVYTADTGAVPGTASFHFVVFKTNPSVAGPMAPEVPRHGFKEDSEWAAKRPAEFARYMQARAEAEEAARPRIP